MSRQATSSEQLFRIYERGFVKRLGRDWRVFRYLWRIFWLWLTVGGKLRRAKREAARTGRVSPSTTLRAEAKNEQAQEDATVDRLSLRLRGHAQDHG